MAVARPVQPRDFVDRQLHQYSVERRSACVRRRAGLRGEGLARAETKPAGVAAGRVGRPGKCSIWELAARQYPTGERAQAKGLRFSLQFRQRDAQFRWRGGRVSGGDDLAVAGLPPGKDGTDLRDGNVGEEQAAVPRGGDESGDGVERIRVPGCGGQDALRTAAGTAALHCLPARRGGGAERKDFGLSGLALLAGDEEDSGGPGGEQVETGEKFGS